MYTPDRHTAAVSAHDGCILHPFSEAPAAPAPNFEPAGLDVKVGSLCLPLTTITMIFAGS